MLGAGAKACAMNSRVATDMRMKKERRNRPSSCDASPSIPSPHEIIQRSGIITVQTLSIKRYFGVHYGTIKRPLVYDNLDRAIAKCQRLGQMGKCKPRVQTEPHVFDEATGFSMYGPNTIMTVGPDLWQWENEDAWLLRRKEGVEISTEVSEEKTLPASASSDQPMPQPKAAAPPLAPTVHTGAKSELSRAQQEKHANVKSHARASWLININALRVTVKRT